MNTMFTVRTKSMRKRKTETDRETEDRVEGLTGEMGIRLRPFDHQPNQTGETPGARQS